jgi:hypothetical protein
MRSLEVSKAGWITGDLTPYGVSSLSWQLCLTEPNNTLRSHPDPRSPGAQRLPFSSLSSPLILHSRHLGGHAETLSALLRSYIGGFDSYADCEADSDSEEIPLNGATEVVRMYPWDVRLYIQC